MDERKCYIPKRYIFTMLGFLGIFNVYAMRVNLSVAMVAMVNHTVGTSDNRTEPQVMECANLIPREHSTKAETFVGEQYFWDSKTQGLILGAFFYGYVITQLPGGYLSEKVGAKWLFGGGVFVTAIFTLLTPLAARWGNVPLVTVRVLEGLGEGITFPAMNLLVSQWSPMLERSRMSTVVFTGAQVGNVVSMPISGLLCGTDILGGWPSVFYIFGTIGCIWFLIWALFAYETPRDHPCISKNELNYIYRQTDKTPQKKGKTPWKSIFTSLPMWAVIFGHFGHSLGFFILLTELPTYLSTILHFDIQENGLLSALPYVVQAIASWISSYIADRLRMSNRLSITTIRKIFNSIGLFGPAACLLGVTISGCRPKLILGLFSLGMALNAFIHAGFNVTHIDMSPEFAGTLFGITNSIGSLAGILGPAMVGAFTSSGATIANWSDVFYVTAAVYVVCGVVYAAFASAELQPWAQGEKAPGKDIPIKANINVAIKKK